jgi:hypothetical protein
VSHLKPIACVLFFTSSFALLAVATTADPGRGPWPGEVVGGFGGLFVGLVGGGVTGGRLLGAIDPPADEPGRDRADRGEP